MGLARTCKQALRKLIPARVMRWRYERMAEQHRTDLRTARAQGRRVVHFLHVGKTGGTAISAALENHTHTPNSLLVLHEHLFSLQDVEGQDAAFLLVRDPVKRFVSAFNSRLRQGQPTHYTPWSPEEQLAFECFKTPDALALALSAEDQKLRAQAEHAMQSIQHVKHTLDRWLGDEQAYTEAQHRLMFVGCQEHLTEDFAHFCKLVGLPDTVHLPSSELTAHRAPSHMPKKLSDTSVANLRRWYADDYARIAQLAQHPAASSSLATLLQSLPTKKERGNWVA